MISENLSTIILLIVIIGVVAFDYFQKNKKKNSKKEVALENEKTKNNTEKNKKLILYASLIIIILGFGFYEFYYSPKELISELQKNWDSYTDLKRNKSDLDKARELNSKSLSIIKKLDQKWFVFGDYNELKAFTKSAQINLNYSTVYFSFGDYMNIHNNLNYYRCVYSRQKNDSLIEFIKEKQKIYNRYKYTDFFDNRLNKRLKVLTGLIELFTDTKCDKTFFLSNQKSSKIKNEFIKEFAIFKKNNKDEESLNFIKEIELFIEPSPANIYKYINNKVTEEDDFLSCKREKNLDKKASCYTNKMNTYRWNQKEIDKLNTVYEFLLFGRNRFNVASSKLFSDILISKIVSKSVNNYRSSSLNFNFRLLSFYLENFKFLYSFSSYSLNRDLYLKQKKSVKDNFKYFIVNHIFNNNNLDLNTKSGLIRTYTKIAVIEKKYTEMQNGLKNLRKILEKENLSRFVYYYTSEAYYEVAQYQFDKSDWLGSIESYEKAIETIEMAKEISGEDYYDNDLALYLRNIFAAKWNYKENGDKMGACNDLRRAKDLNGDYYSYYIRNCSN